MSVLLAVENRAEIKPWSRGYTARKTGGGAKVAEEGTEERAGGDDLVAVEVVEVKGVDAL